MSTHPLEQTALVVGASSGIAQALIKHLVDFDLYVHAVSRSTIPANLQHLSGDRLSWHTLQYSEQGIHDFCEHNRECIRQLNYVFTCNGFLYSKKHHPEKQLSQLSSQHFLASMEVNTLLPMIWLQNISEQLQRDQPIQFVVFSARVGSISDNGLGGWYSYRASKAALNMLVKSFSIELARRYKYAGIMLFHPGTTDTGLSKPFQKNVPDGKLFTADFVAKQLWEILKQNQYEKPICYLDWNNQTIPW